MQNLINGVPLVQAQIINNGQWKNIGLRRSIKLSDIRFQRSSSSTKLFLQ